mmetsp:Transcript_37707/g.82833  ORF Transcript_37707/g.82833 Transcript_37707/m.82833 type:complete len:273 (-) Transcript_37707:946-1764(-)
MHLGVGDVQPHLGLPQSLPPGLPIVRLAAMKIFKARLQIPKFLEASFHTAADTVDAGSRLRGNGSHVRVELNCCFVEALAMQVADFLVRLVSGCCLGRKSADHVAVTPIGVLQGTASTLRDLGAHLARQPVRLQGPGLLATEAHSICVGAAIVRCDSELLTKLPHHGLEALRQRHLVLRSFESPVCLEPVLLVLITPFRRNVCLLKNALHPRLSGGELFPQGLALILDLVVCLLDEVLQVGNRLLVNLLGALVVAFELSSSLCNLSIHVVPQ